MGCHPRSPVASRRVAALLFALGIAGCGGNSSVVIGSAGSSAAGISVEGSSTTVSSLLTLMMLLNASRLGDQVGPAMPPDPVMEASRRVVERDCTRPIEDWSANLRCRPAVSP
jgi:hypothetical protein